MLRRISTTLFTFTQSNSVKQALLKSHAPQSRTLHSEVHFKKTDEAIDPHRMLSMLLTPAVYQNLMFTQVYPNVPVPTLHDIIHRAKDFNTLAEPLTNRQKQRLSDTLASSMDTLRNFLAPLSAENQRQVMDFIGLDRLREFGKKDTLEAYQTSEKAFFLTSESLNFALKRENLDYLFKMRDGKKVPEKKKEQEKVEIAAERPAGIKNSMMCP